jgi:hypothetical protein
VSTDFKNLSDSGSDQIYENDRQTDRQTVGTTAGHKIFEISTDLFLKFKLLWMKGGATGLQVLLAQEV